MVRSREFGSWMNGRRKMLDLTVICPRCANGSRILRVRVPGLCAHLLIVLIIVSGMS